MAKLTPSNLARAESAIPTGPKVLAIPTLSAAMAARLRDALRREIPELIEGTRRMTPKLSGITFGGLCITEAAVAPRCSRCRRSISPYGNLKACRANVPLFRLLGGFDARVSCYAGGIDLDLSVEALLRQTDDNLAKGFRAIKMKVGRPDLASDLERVQAMRKHLGDGFPLMADANMRWTVEQAIRAARALHPYCMRMD
jgi:hypothetical protein